jgi:predicted DNA binding CopG/RHH family protein
VPRQKLVIPSFSSERAEAAWWDTNRAAVEADLRATLRQSQKAQPREVMTPGFKKKFLPANLRLAGADLDAARKIAEDRGIGYEAYLKSLLNDPVR